MQDDATNNSEASNIRILNITGGGTFNCSIIPDGLCPNDFSNVTICANNTDGTSSDYDCGIHAFMKCLNVYNTSGGLEGNTCEKVTIPPITNTQCGIMNVLTNKTQLHAQCVNGAVVQGLDGCPICLKPGETITYGEGVTKYTPSKADPLGKTVENRTLTWRLEPASGVIGACPKKYDLSNISGTMRCIPQSYQCDSGYRTIVGNNVTHNYLLLKCDQPAWFNTTTNRWQFNNNCLYKYNVADPNKYSNYCGLNSWYMGYEIYDDQFGIVVI